MYITRGLTRRGCTLFGEDFGDYNQAIKMKAYYEEEKDVLEAFFAFASSFTHLIHFNGKENPRDSSHRYDKY